MALILFGLMGVALPLRAEAVDASQSVHANAQFEEAFDRGVEAFRCSQLDEAARAFQRAYLIRPNEPKLQSWLALVQDEQARRAAMTYALDDARYSAASARAQEPGAPPREPLWKRLFLPQHVPLGLNAGLTSSAEEGRPEILEAGKRAGYQRLYKEGIGFQPIQGFGFSGRSEIVEEPNPVDDYILEAKVLGQNSTPEFRDALVPLFTRSEAARFVTDIEPWPRFTYEFDYREIFHEFQTRFNFKERDLRTHAFNALYTFPTIPWLGDLTINPWYKRVIQRSRQDVGSFQDRDEVLMNLSLRQTDNIEYFFQYDTYQSDNVRTPGGSDLQLFKGQLRLRFPSLKLFVIPSFEYSDTDFDPGDDEFIKRDLFVDWGFDITPRLRASSKEQMVYGQLSQPTASPSNPQAQTLGTFNTLSYELFKDFDVSLGLDYSGGLGFDAFNNMGLRTEVEYFKPGIVRAKFGYEWLTYYNIDDDLSLLYFRVFLFQ